MARDGTNRGGRRRNTGPKPQAVNEKIQQGKSVKIINNDIPTLDVSELEAVDLPDGVLLEGSQMPKPSEYLSTQQKKWHPSWGRQDIYRNMAVVERA